MPICRKMDIRPTLWVHSSLQWIFIAMNFLIEAFLCFKKKTKQKTKSPNGNKKGIKNRENFAPLSALWKSLSKVNSTTDDWFLCFPICSIAFFRNVPNVRKLVRHWPASRGDATKCSTSHVPGMQVQTRPFPFLQFPIHSFSRSFIFPFFCLPIHPFSPFTHH